jgi:hypothetical protein
MLYLELARTIISHLIALLLGAWASKIKDRFLDFASKLRKRPQVEKFVERVEESNYKKYPDSNRPYCFRRTVDHAHESDDKEYPVFHFFIEPDSQPQRFLAFLVPSIASGYGRRKYSRHEIGRVFDRNHLKFDESWASYLSGIGAKIQSDPKHENSHFGEEPPLDRLPSAARIIFFDKEALKIFLFDHDSIFKRAQDSSDSPLTVFAQDIIHYAFDVVMIHDRTKSYDRIKCRYVSESAVAASEFYDFGLYTIDGIDIVYAPIFLKDGDKTICQEKVYIGDNTRHRARIQEFVDDFKTVWSAAEVQCDQQHGREKEIDIDSLSTPDSTLFTDVSYFTPEFFDAVYCKQIKKILEDRLRFKFLPW